MADTSFIGGEHAESVQRAVNSNLSKSLVALFHPGSIALNDTFYSHAENSSLAADISEIRLGVLRVPATSLGLSSNINFTLLNRSILAGAYVTGSITIPQGAVLPSLWFYNAIQNVQIAIPGIANLQYNGQSMLSFLLRSNTTDRRNELSNLVPGAVGVTGGTTVTFAAPLVLPWTESNVAHSGYYMDADTLTSVFQISFLMYPTYQWIGTIPQNIVGSLPTQFNQLNMKVFSQVDLLNSEFSAGKNSDIYRLPFSYLTSYPLFQQTNAGPAGIQQIQLQSLPSGELTSVLISAIPSQNRGIAAGGQAVDFSPIQFTYSRLTLQGQDMILLESTQEILATNNFFSVGSSAGFYYNTTNLPFTNSAGVITYSGATGPTNTIATQQRFTALECFIPDPSSCYDSSSKFQLAQNFSGQILTFYYQVPAQFTTSTCPYIDWYITYVSNGIISVENGAARLIT